MENYFNEIANSWDNLIKYNDSKVENILDQIKLKPDANILDVGTGTGILIPYLIRKTKGKGDITAIDFSQNMIQIAKEKYSEKSYANVDFQIKDITKIDLTPQFDLIICFSSFPHFENKQKVIKNLYNGLKVGGKLLIAHPDSRKKVNERHQEIGGTISNHLIPTLPKLIKLLESNNLRVNSFRDSNDLFYIIAEKK